MRKFKAKRINNGEWVFGFYGERGFDSYIIQEIIRESGGDSFNDIEVDPGTLCMSSPFVDKEDNVIYEGDIISDGNPMNQGVVELDPDCGWIFVNSHATLHVSLYCYHYSIIGNIHETA